MAADLLLLLYITLRNWSPVEFELMFSYLTGSSEY